MSLTRLGAAAVVASMMFGTTALAQDSEMTTFEQRASYAIGLTVAQGMSQDQIGMELDVEMFSRALGDVLGGKELALNDQEIGEIFNEMRQNIAAMAEAKAEETKAAGVAFLEENKGKDGITTTASGLQYRVITAGDGATPTADQTVEVHYTGKLLDGTKFDSSYDRGTPAQFPVGGVIKGWTEALQLMKVGSKWEVWIPSEIAYGARGAGEDIGPHEVLNFEMELLGIVGQ